MSNVGKMWRHFKTICKHKMVVYRECKACGIWWQGVVHDLSKFSVQEFVPSARYFQGNRSPIEAEKEATGYSNAWLHHKSHNKHHWEYWCDYNNETGEVFPHKIPLRYVIEMVCDWIGAGMVYSGEKWTEDEPLNYYNKVRNGRHFHQDTEKLIVYLLTGIKHDGLTEFHRVCRSMLNGEWKPEEVSVDGPQLIDRDDLTLSIVNREAKIPDILPASVIEAWLNGYATCQHDILDIVRDAPAVAFPRGMATDQEEVSGDE